LIPVVEASQVGEARRAVAALGESLGLGETEAGRASIAVTEAANNLVRHAGGGEILIQPVGEANGVEIIALDRGPGISEMGVALTDGHSTTGTSGTGLGAMRRLSSRFDTYSLPGKGLAILMQICARLPPPAAVESGAICVSKPGEDECGDVWDVRLHPGSCRILIADGLGHGPLAREAALAAARAAVSGSGPSQALEDAHLATRPTRGAALAVAEADLDARVLRYAGFGNIAAMLLENGGSRSLVSMSGTVGLGTHKAREFSYPYLPGAILVMWSDGLTSRWSLDHYPGLLLRHPALIASVLYRDHARGRDDVTVVAARLGRPA
jgi:anti-sigma regulatory factor (Ser/Thr protein kinase)